MHLRAIAACVLFSVIVPLASFAQHAPTPDAGHVTTGSGRTFGDVSEDRILDAIRNARILGRQFVGSTSINLHLHLAGGIDAGFKPRSVTHADHYRAEIAAFRLNRMLGLTRVPPAISRVIPRVQLHVSDNAGVVADRDDSVRGAAIYWVPVLRDSMIDRTREIDRWTSWLRQGGTVPPDQTVRAEEVSTLLVFDYLTGNWDRWSGANVPMDTAGHLIYRDNNGGFEEPFPDAMLNRLGAWLHRTQKFSRAVIDHVRLLTDATVRTEMSLDPDRDHPPLTDSQLRSLLRRRDALLQYVDGLVSRYGATAVYPW